MDHAELVQRAARWLRNGVPIRHEYGQQLSGKFYIQRARCHVVLTERTGHYESPDAIGWAYQGNLSVLVECKASRSDFLRDKDKPGRKETSGGMGKYRYYFAVPGIIKEEDLPPRWGLCEVRGRTTRIVKYAQIQSEHCMRNEMHLLVSELTKYQMVENGQELYPSRAATEVARNMMQMRQLQDQEMV